MRNLQSFKLIIEYDAPLLKVSVDANGAVATCFHLQANIDYNGYFTLAGSSGTRRAD